MLLNMHLKEQSPVRNLLDSTGITRLWFKRHPLNTDDKGPAQEDLGYRNFRPQASETSPFIFNLAEARSRDEVILFTLPAFVRPVS